MKRVYRSRNQQDNVKKTKVETIESEEKVSYEESVDSDEDIDSQESSQESVLSEDGKEDLSLDKDKDKESVLDEENQSSQINNESEIIIEEKKESGSHSVQIQVDSKENLIELAKKSTKGWDKISTRFGCNVDTITKWSFGEDQYGKYCNVHFKRNGISSELGFYYFKNHDGETIY